MSLPDEARATRWVYYSNKATISVSSYDAVIIAAVATAA